MTPENQARFVEHALSVLPKEACGVLVVRKGKELVVPCRNDLAGVEGFIINPEDYRNAADKGDVVGIVHSHPYGAAQPSQIDLVACERLGLPWHIVVVPEVKWVTVRPSGYKAPLIGREFTHGALDCWALVRDAFAQKRNIELPDFVREDGWWIRGENVYLDNINEAGFELVSRDAETHKLKPFDLILMMLNARVPNHGALHLGDNIILHHVYNRLSCREVYGGYWRKITTHIYRHRSLL